MDGDAFGEGADSAVAGAGVDLVADGELSNAGADSDDGAGQIVSESQWRWIVEQVFEFAGADFLVELVEAGCLNFDVYVVVADDRLAHGRFLQRPLVRSEGEGFHD